VQRGGLLPDAPGDVRYHTCVIPPGLPRGHLRPGGVLLVHPLPRRLLLGTIRECVSALYERVLLDRGSALYAVRGG
jgi:hypothetical protein